jgi:polysaccharide biosynthesis/export protein
VLTRVLFLCCLILAFMINACGVVRVIPKSQGNSSMLEGAGSKDRRILASISPSLPPSSSAFGEGDYIFGAEDVIEVSVWKNTELSRTVFVRPDGKISLPLIGDVQATGLTPSELRDAIKVLLRRYKKTPEVSVIVKQINSLSIFLVGEIMQPGKIQLRSETTLLQVITLAGGFTEFANRKKIILLRKENGRERRFKINYNDILSGKNPEGNAVLRRGDTILVP